jgi:hypothetical protein
MKFTIFSGCTALLVLLTGCASAPTSRVADASGHGVSGFETGTRTYTDRQPAFTDLNAEEFFWNNDFGRNEFLHATPGSR